MTWPFVRVSHLGENVAKHHKPSIPVMPGMYLEPKPLETMFDQTKFGIKHSLVDMAYS